MDDRCVVREEVIRTWHVGNEERKDNDYLGGSGKHLGLYMREIIFQNGKYVKTVIRGNPFHIMVCDNKSLSSLSCDEIEKMCEEEAKKSDWKIQKEYYETTNKMLLGILKEYFKKESEITLDRDSEGDIVKGRIVIPKHIAKKLSEKSRKCYIYHDEEEGSVFIHLNTEEGVFNFNM